MARAKAAAIERYATSDYLLIFVDFERHTLLIILRDDYAMLMLSLLFRLIAALFDTPLREVSDEQCLSRHTRYHDNIFCPSFFLAYAAAIAAKIFSLFAIRQKSDMMPYTPCAIAY